MKTLTGFMITILTLCPATAYTDPLEQAIKLLEQAQMSRLAEQQRIPGISIKKFYSDGCSGGMSEAWKYLAKISPQFAQSVGQKPPWERCCLEHDRHYWQGDSEMGYEKRKQADLELRSCVRHTGVTQSEQISRQLGLTANEVIEITNTTADLMYQAVRIGGGPCTGLPWRWGHGWPECASSLQPGI